MKTEQISDSGRTQRLDKAMVAIKRLWGNVPVVDAKKDLRVMVLPQDFANAKRKEPGCCLFARACQRSFGCSKVLFFKSVAYVELPQSNGKTKVERFLMTKDARRLVEAFDRGEIAIPKGGFLLKSPAKTLTLEGQRIQHSKQLARRKSLGIKRARGGSIINGKVKGQQGKGKYEKEPMSVDMEVRSGTGAFHMVPLKVKKGE